MDATRRRRSVGTKRIRRRVGTKRIRRRVGTKRIEHAKRHFVATLDLTLSPHTLSPHTLVPIHLVPIRLVVPVLSIPEHRVLTKTRCLFTRKSRKHLGGRRSLRFHTFESVGTTHAVTRPASSSSHGSGRGTDWGSRSIPTFQLSSIPTLRLATISTNLRRLTGDC